jgi:hypothetical protein
MPSLEQLVQDWLCLDKVRICLAKRSAILLYCMDSRKRQGLKSRDYGNREITRNLREGSGIYHQITLLSSGSEISLKGRESSSGQQVRSILVL